MYVLYYVDISYQSVTFENSEWYEVFREAS